MKCSTRDDLKDAAESPSSQRAWIEINAAKNILLICSSPSSRRAWIEIVIIRCQCHIPRVALLAEGVD